MNKTLEMNFQMWNYAQLGRTSYFEMFLCSHEKTFYVHEGSYICGFSCDLGTLEKLISDTLPLGNPFIQEPWLKIFLLQMWVGNSQFWLNFLNLAKLLLLLLFWFF